MAYGAMSMEVRNVPSSTGLIPLLHREEGQWRLRGFSPVWTGPRYAALDNGESRNCKTPFSQIPSEVENNQNFSSLFAYEHLPLLNKLVQVLLRL